MQNRYHQKKERLLFIPLRGPPALMSRKRCEPINASAVINVLSGGPKTRIGTRSMDTLSVQRAVVCVISLWKVLALSYKIRQIRKAVSGRLGRIKKGRCRET